jgi:hypothetical protein
MLEEIEKRIMMKTRKDKGGERDERKEYTEEQDKRVNHTRFPG